MWKTFQSDGRLYMIKIEDNENVEIYLTDLINIWTQSVPKDSVLKQFQECNPLFDVKVDEAVTQIFSLVSQISDINIEIAETPEALQLTLRSQKSEFKIEFIFNFVKASSTEFLKQVTVPLMQTVKHLEEQQKVLYNLIQKKDRELEEYKLEKGEISRDDLVTDKFDESMFSKVDQKSMLNIFGSSKTFWDCFVQKHGDIAVKIEDVRKDPWNHIKRKREVYSAKTVTKKGKGINYDKTN